VIGRHAALLEHDLGGVAGAHAQLVLFLPRRHAGRPALDDERRDAAVPLVRSVTAIATMTPPTLPWVVKVFDPLSTHPSPSRVATVRVPAASAPAEGSVRPHAASISPLASGGM